MSTLCLVRDNGGEVVLYQWVEWLREYVEQKSQMGTTGKGHLSLQ